MKKLLLILLFVIPQVNAEVIKLKKEVICGTNIDMAKMLIDYNEKLFWQGKDAESGNNISLFINSTTLSWTAVESNKEAACILATGEGFRTKSLPSKETF